MTKRKINTKVRNATVSKADGKTFRSKLELYCYMALTKANINFDYEYPRFTLVPKLDYPNDA